ncbi:DUF3969 family protein [Pseudomonas protegens]|uniref:DUF3969 family protein n=1 Tax=Pseudomonas TaxID=286 RepID=UPI000C9C59F4|nr:MULTISPECIES: DUF3969 family protein [Pseudomonas]MCL9657106.1 DUF3969 family protein [Pseudomonas protegens]PNG29376.1 hypothetical protein A1348_25485 [Pseudomonas protegens]BCT34111.1 hypothetical protein PproGo58_36060 [Pseudomonas protegens]
MVEALGSEQATRLVCTLAIGLLTSLRTEAISLEEAEWILFTPRTASILQDKGLSPELCNLIMEACELEDVQSLRPDRLEANVQQLAERFASILQSDPGYAHRASEKIRREDLYVIR